MNEINFFYWMVSLFTLWWLTKIILKIRLDYVVGLFLYGGLLLSLRSLVGVGKVSRKIRNCKPHKKVKLEPITKVAQFEKRFRLKPFQVVMGFGGTSPIKIDYFKHHTLIGGVSGFGKTHAVNIILLGLFAKGKRFTESCDVYLIDLKGNEDDHLHRWKPLLAGYYSIADGGDPMEAVRVMNDIIEVMHQKHKKGNNTKRILVFIDEIAMLTSMSSDKRIRAEGEAALNRLSGQLRATGTIIAATQYPKHDVLPTSARFNLDRRFCFYTNNTREAELVLGTKPEANILPTQVGQFILREPGKAGLIQGRTVEISLPGEIDEIVYQLSDEAAESDERLQLFKQIAQSLEAGDKVIGIIKVVKTNKAATEPIKLSYRHFALAGAFEPPEKAGQSYLMKVGYEEGFGLVRKYIEEGNWHSEPESVIGKDV